MNRQEREQYVVKATGCVVAYTEMIRNVQCYYGTEGQLLAKYWPITGKFVIM